MEEALDSYGRNLGIAFQLDRRRDRLCLRRQDDGQGHAGDDFRDGKVTLPVILANARGTTADQKFWKDAMEGRRASDEDLAEANRLLRETGAIDDTLARARHYGQRAIDALGGIGGGKAKAALVEAVEFAVAGAHIEPGPGRLPPVNRISPISASPSWVRVARRSSALSLMSLLTSGTGTQSAFTYSDPKVAAATRLVSGLAAATTGTTKSDAATISAAAKIAAAEKADNAKDFGALTADVRATLDKQYAADKAAGAKIAKPDLSAFSGRALAAMALNRDGDFSRREVAAARIELRGRDRQALVGATSGGFNTNALAAYSRQMVATYDGISSEEREALGWRGRTRASAAAFVQRSDKAAATDNNDA